MGKTKEFNMKNLSASDHYRPQQNALLAALPAEVSLASLTSWKIAWGTIMDGIGRALIGKRVNDAVEIITPNGKMNYKIKEIKIV